MDQLHELDDKVFSEYINRKSESVIGIIEQGMHVGYFDWDHCSEATQVRNYVKEVLFNLVLIHAEVRISCCCHGYTGVCAVEQSRCNNILEQQPYV